MAQPTGGALRSVVESRVGQAWQELVMTHAAVQQAGTDAFTSQNLTDLTDLLDEARDAAIATFAKFDDINNPS